MFLILPIARVLDRVKLKKILTVCESSILVYYKCLELENEYKQVKQSLEDLENEINILQTKRKVLRKKCNDLEVQIDFQQSSKLALECKDYKWSHDGRLLFWQFIETSNCCKMLLIFYLCFMEH